jgi:hypothetical protein
MSRFSLVVAAAVMATAALAKAPSAMTIEQYVNLPDPYFNWTVAGVRKCLHSLPTTISIRSHLTPFFFPTHISHSVIYLFIYLFFS